MKFAMFFMAEYAQHERRQAARRRWTIAAAAATGLAGASVEDWSGSAIYERQHATERVRAAVEAAAGGRRITARAENLIRDVDDLDDTIARLQAFAAAGADVLFAPGLSSAEQIRAVLSSVGFPLKRARRPRRPAAPRVAQPRVRRVSVGGAFAFAAYGALVRAAREMLDTGRYGYGQLAALGLKRDAVADAVPAVRPTSRGLGTAPPTHRRLS